MNTHKAAWYLLFLTSIVSFASELQRVNSLINRGDPTTPLLTFNANGQLVQDPRQALWKLTGSNDGKNVEASYDALKLRLSVDLVDRDLINATMKSNPKDFDSLLGWNARIKKGLLTSITQCFSDNSCVTATASRCKQAREIAEVKNMRELMQLMRKCDKVFSASLPMEKPEFDAESQSNRMAIQAVSGSKSKLEEAKVTATQFLVGMGDACDALGDPIQAKEKLPEEDH